MRTASTKWSERELNQWIFLHCASHFLSSHILKLWRAGRNYYVWNRLRRDGTLYCTQPSSDPISIWRVSHYRFYLTRPFFSRFRRQRCLGCWQAHWNMSRVELQPVEQQHHKRNFIVRSLFMAALRNRCGHYIFALWFLSIVFLFYFSPDLSRRRLDVYHTSTHGVALVRI